MSIPSRSMRAAARFCCTPACCRSGPRAACGEGNRRMATNLQTPILNSLIRSVNFFNGRLLTGEDLTAEQQSNRAARNLLGRAIGSGVVHGLGVTESVKFSNVQAPVLTVSKGLAINHRGAPLLLTDDTDIALVR